MLRRRRSPHHIAGLLTRGVALLALLTLVPSCGGPTLGPEVAEPAPKPRNAAETAWNIVHAQTGAMVYVDRVRGRPIAQKLQSLELFRPYLEATGIRPDVDFDRAFVAAPATDRADASIVVAQHHLQSPRIIAALAALIASGRIEGSAIEGAPVPAFRLTARGQTKVLALIEPDILVLLPEAHMPEITRFVGTGGFPDPTGPEAVLARAIDPARTVRGPRIPAIPPTISMLRAAITLDADGGADVMIDGPSAGPEQARADAAALTHAIDEATSIKVAFVRLRVFKPIPFIAEGAEVRSKVHLSAGEIDTLLGAIAAFVPR